MDLAEEFAAVVASLTDEHRDLSIFTGIQWGVNRWGSCQYTQDLQMYELLLRHGHRLLNVLCLHLQEERSKVQMTEAFLAYCNDMELDEEENSEVHDRINQVAGSILETGKLDEVFVFFNERAHDLWTAAPLIAGFAGYSFKPKVPCRCLPAIACYVLIRDRLVTTEECFHEFDT